MISSAEEIGFYSNVKVENNGVFCILVVCVEHAALRVSVFVLYYLVFCHFSLLFAFATSVIHSLMALFVVFASFFLFSLSHI